MQTLECNSVRGLGLRLGQYGYGKQKISRFIVDIDTISSVSYRVNLCQQIPLDAIFAQLRSRDLVELQSRTTRYGKQSFPASAPLIWNSLTKRPFATFLFQSTAFICTFERSMFRRAYRTALAPLWHLSVKSLNEHKCPYLPTYLLT